MHCDDYYERQAKRGEDALRIIVLLWVFLCGGVAGWVLTWLVD